MSSLSFWVSFENFQKVLDLWYVTMFSNSLVLWAFILIASPPAFILYTYGNCILLQNISSYNTSFSFQTSMHPSTVITQLDYFQEPVRFMANVKIFYHKLVLRVLMRSKVKSTNKNVCKCLTSEEMSRVKQNIEKTMEEVSLWMWRKEVRSWCKDGKWDNHTTLWIWVIPWREVRA